MEKTKHSLDPVQKKEASEVHTAKTLQTLSDLFSETWKIFTKNLGILLGVYFFFVLVIVVFVAIVVFFGILSMILGGHMNELSGAPLILVIVVGVLLVLFFIVAILVLSGWHTSSTMVVIQYSFQEEKMKFGEILRIGWKYVWRMIGATMLTGIITFIGFVFFIVPGIFFTVKLTFVPYILIVERTTIMEAFSRSWSLSEGYFWPVLGRVLLLWVISVGVSLASSFIPGVGMIITVLLAILSPIYIYSIYRNLVQLQKA